MNTPLCHQTANNNFSLNLRKQAILTVPDASKVRIGVTDGSIWITLDNDTKDYVLESCGVFTTKEPRRAVVYALQPSSITVSAVDSVKTESAARSSSHARLAFTFNLATA